MHGTRNFGAIVVLVLSLRAMSLAAEVAITDYAPAAPYDRPNQITVGPDGALWFTETEPVESAG